MMKNDVERNYFLTTGLNIQENRLVKHLISNILTLHRSCSTHSLMRRGHPLLSGSR